MHTRRIGEGVLGAGAGTAPDYEVAAARRALGDAAASEQPAAREIRGPKPQQQPQKEAAEKYGRY